jgi:Xaa-Pro aminopeptidase
MRSGRFSARRSGLRRSFAGDGVQAHLVTSLPNVRYLTGFTGSSGALLVYARGATFVTDFRYRLQAAREVSGCRRVEQRGTMTETLAQLIGKKGLKRVGFEGAHLSFSMHRRLSRKLKGVRLVAAQGRVERLRMVKDAGEIALLRQAVLVAERAYRRAARRLAGRSEREVAASMERAVRENGAEGVAFAPIVAGGRRAALPHAVPGRAKIREGRLVILDFGARFRGYHSDISRTRLPGGGGARAKELYRLVAKAQREAVRAVRPGVEARAVDRAARGVIERAGYGDCFGHGTGHGVGLEVHEGPSISSGSREVLEPGMVFTVEPGVYVENFGGVRIEDMVLVTRSGCEIMTRAIPAVSF